MTIEVFCKSESQTGICITYNTQTRRMSVAMPCHPEAEAVKAFTDHIVCTYCRCTLKGEKIADAIRSWSMFFTIGTDLFEVQDPTAILRWTSGWTGIPTHDLDVKLSV